MPTLRRFLSRRWLLAVLGSAALLFGLAMLHPYPRQSLFGPKIRGKPWCVWEAEIRRHVHDEKYDQTLSERLYRLLGVKPNEMSWPKSYDHPEMLPLVLAMAEDPDLNVRREILKKFPHLTGLHDPSALPVLRRRLEDDDPIFRVMAARAIWRVAKDKQVLAVVLRDLEDCQDEKQRFLAIWFFREACDEAPELYACLATHARYPNSGVRKGVMVAMGTFGKKGLPILLAGLEDAAPDVRATAIFTLIKLGRDAKDAIPALQGRLRDSDIDVRSAAVEALLALEPERFGYLKSKEN